MCNDHLNDETSLLGEFAGEVPKDVLSDADGERLGDSDFWGHGMVSLDDPENGWLEEMQAPWDDDPLEAYLKVESLDRLKEYLEGLQPRYRKVLELRFGLLDGKPRSLEETGREFGVTRERIRQIEGRLLTRHSLHLRDDKSWDWLADQASANPANLKS